MSSYFEKHYETKVFSQGAYIDSIFEKNNLTKERISDMLEAFQIMEKDKEDCTVRDWPQIKLAQNALALQIVMNLIEKGQ